MLLIRPNIVPQNQYQYKSKITFKGQIDRQITPKVQPKISQTSKKALNILKNMVKIPLLIVGGLIMTPILVYKLLKETDKEDKRIKEKRMAQQTQDAQKPNFPEFDGKALESQVNMNEKGIALIPKDAEFAQKLSFDFPEGSTITFVDGTKENLKDYVEKNGFLMKHAGCRQYFTKDENGNVFKKTSENSKYRYYNLSQTNNDNYYAMSEDKDIYLIDLSKIPAGKEFCFNDRPCAIETLIPEGAIVRYGDKILEPNSKECKIQNLTCYPDFEPRISAFIGNPKLNTAVDNETQDKFNVFLENLKKEEQALVDEFAEEIKNDAIQRNTKNLIIGSSIFHFELSAPRTVMAPNDSEIYFYKKAYDYYIKKYPEYKDYKFSFENVDECYKMKIIKDDKIVKTISGYGKSIDGPIFSHSRWKANLGEFEMKFPRI